MFVFEHSICSISIDIRLYIGRSQNVVLLTQQIKIFCSYENLKFVSSPKTPSVYKHCHSSDNKRIGHSDIAIIVYWELNLVLECRYYMHE